MRREQQDSTVHAASDVADRPDLPACLVSSSGVDLQGDEYTYHNEYDLTNGVFQVFARLLFEKEGLSDLSKEFDH